MSNITASSDMSQIDSKDIDLVIKFIDLFMQNVVQVVNGQLDFKTNVNCKLLSITFSAANTNTAINHGLGRIPAGYIITGASAAALVYNGTGNTTSVLNLMASAPATVGLLVF